MNNNEEETIIVDEEQGIQQLRECEEKIEAHERTRYPAQCAWLQIASQQLWQYSDENCSSFEDYVEKKGYDKSYISRLTRAVRFCDELHVPPDLMPCESALRPLMKTCYTQSEKEQMYRYAYQFARERQGLSGGVDGCGDSEEGMDEDREVANGNSRGECGGGISTAAEKTPAAGITVKPTAQDIRDAISNFTGAKEIILSALEKRVDRSTKLETVFCQFADGIDSPEILLSVLNDFINQSSLAIDEDDQQAVQTVAKHICDDFYAKIDEILNGGAEDDIDEVQNEEDEENKN